MPIHPTLVSPPASPRNAMTDAIEQASVPRPTSPPETAFESAFTGEPTGTHPKHHTLDHAFAMEATTEDIEREREYIHRHSRKNSKGKTPEQAGTPERKHHEHHAHPHLDKVVQAMFDPYPTPEHIAEAEKKAEEKRHKHEEHEKAKAERRKSQEGNANGHKRDLSGTFGFEATKKDRNHEEEKVRKSVEKKRKSLEGRHHTWGIDIPKFFKRHEKCEEKPECQVPEAEKEHKEEECPHA